jgi:hypothetical protein
VSLVSLALALMGQLMLAGGAMAWAGALMIVTGGLLIGVGTALGRTRLADDDADQPGVRHDEARAVPRSDGLIGGRFDVAALVLVTLVAAAFRLPWLGQLPPGLAPEEASLGLDAVDVLRGGWTATTWAGWPIFHAATIASVAAFGSTPFALRLPAALAGIAFAPALYLLGRQLGGSRLGTLAGLLGAVAFWHADLTRGAWGYGAWGLTCETLGLALVALALRRRTAVAAALAGLAFGLALQVSWAALAAIGAGACLAVSAADTRATSWRRGRGMIVPFLVFFAVAAGPIVLGISIPDRPPTHAAATAAPVAASPATVLELVGAWTRLLLMLNVAGDPSPLHTLRGEAMFDPVTATLFVLGIGVALGSRRGGVRTALLAWLAGALVVAAVVGRPQQPDGVAAIHAIAPALLLAGAAVSATTRGIHPGPASGKAWPLDLAVVLIVAIVGLNGHALFVRRPADGATWTAYASAEVLAAREIGKLTSTHTIYLADVWLDHPTIRFLAPGLVAPRRLDPATTLPLAHNETFAYFAPGDQDVVTDDLERLYEAGEIDRYRSPLDGSTVVRSFRAPAKVVAEARGVTLRTTPLDRGRAARQTLPAFQLDWPAAGEPARPSTLELFSAVKVDLPGVYGIRLDGPPGAALELNGLPVGVAGQQIEVTLAGGPQRVRILATVKAPAHVELRWAPPGSSTLQPIPLDRLYREQRAAIGLLALYRSGTDPAAPAELARVERYLQRVASPPALARPSVADWVGVVDAPKSGTYRIRLEASGPASLWLDGGAIPLASPTNEESASVVLTEGDHRIRVRLIDTVGPTRLNLLWAPPGDDLDAIPTSRFRPPDVPIDAALTIPGGPEALLAPLGAPRIRWLVSTAGEPRAVAVGPDGQALIANVSARQLEQVVGEGSALAGLPATVSVPADLETGPDGRIWALDALHGSVLRLEADGTVGLSVENRELGLYRPRGLGVAPDGSILVADTGGNRIVRLAETGELLARIGPDVGGPERIRQPTDVAVGPDGELFVVNGEGGAVLRLTADGAYDGHWTVLASDTERGPHLAIGPDRSLWVSEPEGRRVSRFTFYGWPAGVVDQTREGRLLRVPVGIAIGPDGTLYVADASLRAVVAIAFQP